MGICANTMNRKKGFKANRLIKCPTTNCAKEATAYTMANNKPKAAGSSITPTKRSVSSKPLPLVVKLNNTLLVTAAAVITTSARASMGAGRLTLAPPLRLAGEDTSGGQLRANKRPHKSAPTPGTTKAARQPSH